MARTYADMYSSEVDGGRVEAGQRVVDEMQAIHGELQDHELVPTKGEVMLLACCDAAVVHLLSCMRLAGGDGCVASDGADTSTLATAFR